MNASQPYLLVKDQVCPANWQRLMQSNAVRVSQHYKLAKMFLDTFSVCTEPCQRLVTKFMD